VGDRIAAGTRHYTVAWGAPPAPTPEVYRAVDLRSPRRDGAAFIEALGRGVLEPFNRLEEAAFQRFPELTEVSAELERILHRRPLLSGSGSAFFFVLRNREEAEVLAGRVAAETGLLAHAASTGVQ
jgi:4-diphosphocytidyl-2C-methyl-D-erythritol kinase